MTSITITIMLVAMTAAQAVQPRVDAGGPGEQGRPFDTTIAPILWRRCLDCHSGADAKGKLDLSRSTLARRGGKSGPAIVPGQVEESLLWERVESDEMPPKVPLPAAEKALLRSGLPQAPRGEPSRSTLFR